VARIVHVVGGQCWILWLAVAIKPYPAFRHSCPVSTRAFTNTAEDRTYRGNAYHGFATPQSSCVLVVGGPMRQGRATTQSDKQSHGANPFSTNTDEDCEAHETTASGHTPSFRNSWR